MFTIYLFSVCGWETFLSHFIRLPRCKEVIEWETINKSLNNRDFYLSHTSFIFRRDYACPPMQKSHLHTRGVGLGGEGGSILTWTRNQGILPTFAAQVIANKLLVFCTLPPPPNYDHHHLDTTPWNARKTPVAGLTSFKHIKKERKTFENRPLTHVSQRIISFVFRMLSFQAYFAVLNHITPSASSFASKIFKMFDQWIPNATPTRNF